MSLSREEESKLMLDYKTNNNLVSRNKLIECLMPTVKYQAFKLTKNKFLMDDLISEGVVGLIKAIDKFDITLGNRLTSFAMMYIRGAMLDFIKTNSSMVQCNINSTDSCRALEKIKKFYYPEILHKEFKENCSECKIEYKKALDVIGCLDIEEYTDTPYEETPESIAMYDQLLTTTKEFINSLDGLPHAIMTHGIFKEGKLMDVMQEYRKTGSTVHYIKNREQEKLQNVVKDFV